MSDKLLFTVYSDLSQFTVYSDLSQFTVYSDLSQFTVYSDLSQFTVYSDLSQFTVYSDLSQFTVYSDLSQFTVYVVGLTFGSYWEMVFTLFSSLILINFWMKNPLTSADFSQQVPKTGFQAPSCVPQGKN